MNLNRLVSLKTLLSINFYRLYALREVMVKGFDVNLKNCYDNELD